MDSSIGSWDSMLTYWFIRPPQADPAITLIPAIGLPNHPSYPSAHSCYCGAAAGILSAFFPGKPDALDRSLLQAGLGGISAGLHYGLVVGRGRKLAGNAVDPRTGRVRSVRRG